MGLPFLTHGCNTKQKKDETPEWLRQTVCSDWTYLTLRRVGHAPHGRNHRQGPRGLVGVLLPGNRIVGEGAITGTNINNKKNHVADVTTSPRREPSVPFDPPSRPPNLIK